jgi:hypothetical protein
MGGVIAIGVGFCWKVAEAAHNWTFLADVADNATAHGLVTHVAQPPVMMLILGVVWVLFADRIKPGGGGDPPALGHGSVAEEIRAALNTPDDLLLRVDQYPHGHSLILVKRSRKTATAEDLSEPRAFLK